MQSLADTMDALFHGRNAGLALVGNGIATAIKITFIWAASNVQNIRKLFPAAPPPVLREIAGAVKTVSDWIANAPPGTVNVIWDTLGDQFKNLIDEASDFVKDELGKQRF